MRTAVVSALLFCCLGAIAESDTRCFELRIYHAAPGKLDALQARFRDHTCALFEKHGLTNIGYWIPVDNKDNLLIYVIAAPDRAAHDKSWQEFVGDPDWKKAKSESEVGGKLVDKADSIFLTAADFSPVVASSKSEKPRTFELRTYTPAKDKMDALKSRFRDHSIALLMKHGITNVAYWIRADKDNNQLIYLLAHASKEEGDKNSESFRADPEWQKVKKESEANGPLTEKTESVYMTPTDFSPLK